MKKYILSTLGLLLIVISLTLGVSNSIPANADSPKFAKEKVSVYLGKTKMLDLENASNDIIWRSEDEDVVTINSDGRLTPVAVGNTIVYATYKGIDYPCQVTVKEPYLNYTEIEMFPFEGITLFITGTKVKKWEISDETVISCNVTYDSKFELKAMKEGESIITIKGKDKRDYVCHITVVPCTYKATYYDKKQTKIKGISYYVDGKLQKYNSYNKSDWIPFLPKIKYSLTYYYEDDCYSEYKETAGYLNSRTVYDYDDNIIREISYFYKTSLENADENIREDKFKDDNGYRHELVYSIRNSEGTKIRYMSREEIYFPEDGKLSSSVRYNSNGQIERAIYYNQNPYYFYKKIYRHGNSREEEFYDSTGRRIGRNWYDENNNIVTEYSY